MQGACSQAGRHAWTQALLGDRLSENRLAQGDELIDERLVTLLGLAQLLGKFATMQQDGEDPPLLFVFGDPGNAFDAQRVQRLQAISLGVFEQTARELFRRQAYLCLLYTSPSPRDRG